MFDKNDFIQFLNLWSQHIDLLYDKSIEDNPCYRHIMKQKARYTPEMVKEICNQSDEPLWACFSDLPKPELSREFIFNVYLNKEKGVIPVLGYFCGFKPLFKKIGVEGLEYQKYIIDDNLIFYSTEPKKSQLFEILLKETPPISIGNQIFSHQAHLMFYQKQVNIKNRAILRFKKMLETIPYVFPKTTFSFHSCVKAHHFFSCVELMPNNTLLRVNFSQEKKDLENLFKIILNPCLEIHSLDKGKCVILKINRNKQELSQADQAFFYEFYQKFNAWDIFTEDYPKLWCSLMVETFKHQQPLTLDSGFGF